MGFFITLAYIAISIDASGLIRYLAFKVLQKGGKVGHKLFFYLYVFFFALGSLIGNDPIILSGTPFLAYMTRVSSNIDHPRAWIHTQFAVANVASAILVSSNPTNLVLAGAFGIKFIEYTANIIVPVVATVIVLFPFLLYIVFRDKSLIPPSITIHELSEEAKAKKPVNPNIPYARGTAGEEDEQLANNEHGNLLSLEEIMNPFLDKGGAAFGALVMAATLVTVLAINAASQSGEEHPVSYVTVPAAFVMLCWDLGFGWYHRHATREIARRGRQEVERAKEERAMKKEEDSRQESQRSPADTLPTKETESEPEKLYSPGLFVRNTNNPTATTTTAITEADDGLVKLPTTSRVGEDTNGALDHPILSNNHSGNSRCSASAVSPPDEKPEAAESNGAGPPTSSEMNVKQRPRTTLVSILSDTYMWSQETFPTVTAVLAHLPFALVPFAFAMFILVQALVTKGWVQVFAYGWDHWVQKTGTVGSIGGMAFLSVILSNVSSNFECRLRDIANSVPWQQFSGTNIGTTILLSRVIQTWVRIHESNGTFITDRTFWATVYAMAIGVNYGAFSTAFSASLAGLLWRDILARKHVHVRRLEFAQVNLPIIAISMIVGCTVLVGEVYIMRDNSEYNPSWENGHAV
jgi:Na+/H+ antiporter NhaD/arsenite permease-like protein